MIVRRLRMTVAVVISVSGLMAAPFRMLTSVFSGASRPKKCVGGTGSMTAYLNRCRGLERHEQRNEDEDDRPHARTAHQKEAGKRRQARSCASAVSTGRRLMPRHIAPERCVGRVSRGSSAPKSSHLEQSNGGERGIRTPGTVSGTPDFESGPFGHSGSSPFFFSSTETRKKKRNPKPAGPAAVKTCSLRQQTFVLITFIMSACLAQTTVNSSELATSLAQAAVEKGLAACVQIEGPLKSVYRWQGVIETAEEWRLTFKTTPRQLVALSGWIQKVHPYKTPEWLVWEARASMGYGDWLTEATLVTD